MQDTANMMEKMHMGPKDFRENPGQAPTGMGSGEQAMGKEAGMASGFRPKQETCPGTSAQDTSCSCGSADQGQALGVHGGYQDVYHQGGYQNQSGMFQGPPNYGPAPYGVGTNPGYQYGPMPGQWNPVYPPPGFQQVHPGMYGPQEMGQPFVHPQQFPGGHAQSTGYYQPYGYAYDPPPVSHAGDGGHHQCKGHPKHDAHKYGQFMGLVNDLANGDADASRVISFLGSLDTQFWKGAMVGVTATLLLTNDTVKDSIVGALSGLFGIFGKEADDEATEYTEP
jgi:hypothetical protein